MNGNGVSPKRLACTNLTRVLVWSTSDQSPDELAAIIGIESTFLIQELAQSCHGLLESIPVTLAEDVVTLADDHMSSRVPLSLHS